MNYLEIHNALLEGRDVDESLVRKDAEFYRYLLNNKVAYYYSRHLSTRETTQERKIIERGDIFNAKFFKTLEMFKNVCDREGIEFLLYKTYKYVPDAYDGDIDIFVKEDDFQRFLEIFRRHGFECFEDEPGKGKCIKDGFSVIEPHINMTWGQGSYISNSSFIWDNSVLLEVTPGLLVKSTSVCTEVVSIVGSLIFDPHYLDIYALTFLKSTRKLIDLNKDEILKNIAFPDVFEQLLRWVDNFLSIDAADKKFPLFPETWFFLSRWFLQCRRDKHWRYFFLHIVYYFYWRLRYRFTDKLPYTHDWKI